MLASSSKNKLADAEAEYREAVRLTPDEVDLHSALGSILDDQKRWDEAEAEYREALRLSPDNPDALNILGYLLTERGKNLDEALEMLERAVEARPNEGYILDSLGWVYFKLGDYAEAKRYLLEAADLYQSAENQEHIGDVHDKLGEQAAARAAWEEALKLATDEEQKNRLQNKLTEKK